MTTEQRLVKYAWLRFSLAQFLRLLDLWEATIAARIAKLEGDVVRRREFFDESRSATRPPVERREPGEHYEWNDNEEAGRVGWWRVWTEPRFTADPAARALHHRLLQAQGLLSTVRLELEAQQREAGGIDLHMIPANVRELRDALAAFGIDPCEVP